MGHLTSYIHFNAFLLIIINPELVNYTTTKIEPFVKVHFYKQKEKRLQMKLLLLIGIDM